MNPIVSEVIKKFNSTHIALPINRIALEKSIEDLFGLLFPICNKIEDSKCDEDLLFIYNTLIQNLNNLPVPNAEKIVDAFFEQLPDLQKHLYEDAKAFHQNDPAANSVEEVILTYPGFYALAVHRLANALYRLNIPIIPRLWSEYAHSKGGIDIHPGATIGNRFFLDHGTGTVIGETCIIGDDVKIYQNVTLGALYVTKDMGHKKRHPTVENNVIIYAGATILGGDTLIGHDSIIGGNVFVTQSVEPFSMVYYSTKMKHKNTRNFEEPINFVI